MRDITYAQLDQILRSLGFSFQLDERARVYRHGPSGAVIKLPALPESDRVLPRHLIGVRMTLEAFGISGLVDFDTQVLHAS